MNEMIIKISGDNTVSVETVESGVRSFKTIAPDSLLECISQSVLRGTVSSGLLPKGCLSFAAHDNGNRNVCLLHPADRTDVSYFGTEYKDFPLPKLVFGFQIMKDGRIGSCKLGVIGNDDVIKPETKMFAYPFSNINGFRLCTGNNVLPKCKSLHTLGSLPHYILSMPNNNDYFKPSNNKSGLEMRDLLELLKDKPPEFYYTDILIKNGAVLNDFIKDSVL